MSAAREGTVLVVGIGLIGGSLARALRAAVFAERIAGWDQDAGVRARALDAGVVDIAPATLAEAVALADVIVVCVPVLAVAAVFASVRDHARPGTLLSDACSVKGSVIDAARTTFGTLPTVFVPAHPIAGAERSGIDAARADLYRGHRVILTPASGTDATAIARVRALWEAAGAEVSELDAAEHDRVLALTSHLPHVLAFALVDALASQSERDEIFRYAAGGFRDFTRIASSDVTMWRDICIGNRTAISAAIEVFQQGLGELRAAIDAADAERIAGTFTRARDARGRYLRWLETGSFEAN